MQLLRSRILAPLTLLSLSTLTHAASFCDKRFCFNTTVSGEFMLFQLVTNTSGWVAFGLGESMADADVFFAYKLDGKPVVEQRKSSTYGLPKLNAKQTVEMITDGPALPNNVNVFRFKRRLKATADGEKPYLNQNQNFIFAYTTTTQENAENFGKHESYGKNTLNFYSSKSTRGSTASSWNSYRVAHVVLMSLAWMLFTPMAIFVARYMKDAMGDAWYTTHWSLFLLVNVLTITGFGLMAGTNTKKIEERFNSVHTGLGLAVVILMVLQSVLGKAIDVMFDPHRTEIPWYDKVHWWLGRLVTLAAVICIFFGVSAYQFEAPKMDMIMYGVYGSLLFFILIAFVAGHFIYGGQQIHVNQGPRRSVQSFMQDPYQRKQSYQSNVYPRDSYQQPQQNQYF